MTNSSKIALAIAMIAVAVPASAQRMPVGGSSSNKKADENARIQETADSEAVKPTEATLTTGAKVTVSPQAQKAIVALQKAVNAKDNAAIPGLVADALKVAQTQDDKYIIGSNQVLAATAANDLAGMQAGLNLMAESGVGERANVSMRLADLGKRYLAAGNAAAGSAAFEKAIAVDPNNGAALALLANEKSKAGDKAGAVALLQKSFLADKTAGKVTPEGNYKFAMMQAYEAKLPVANAIARDLVGLYPTADNWRAAIQIYRALNQPRGQQLVDFWRLARATNAVKGEADFDSYLTSLVAGGQLAEAKAVLADAAKQSNVDMSKNQFKEHMAKAAKAPTRAAVDAQLKAAATAAALVAAGDQLYGLGAYAEAASAYRSAAAKGGDTNLANLHLGMALARAGDKAGAQAALKAVSGEHAVVAQYWLAHVGA